MTSDELFDRLIQREPAQPPHAKVQHELTPNLFEQMNEVPSEVPNGTFTLKGPNRHRTFRVRTQKAGALFAPNQRIVYHLVGPENTRNYKGFAFVGSDGSLKIWRRFLTNKSLCDDAEIMWRMFAGREPQGYTLLESRNCIRCNRLLTTPESINAGIGPECAQK